MPAWIVEPEPANFKWIDLFPAEVHVGGEQEPPLTDQELRVIVTDQHFYVIQDTFEGPTAIIKEPLAEFDGSNKVGYTVTTPLNKTYYFKRANNCGCGTRLRSGSPFDSIPLAPRNIRK